MGLDSYLYKMPRYEGATANDVALIEDYLEWKNSGTDSTFKRWCGRDIDLNSIRINKLIDFYEPFFTTKYYAWDTEKKYPHKSIIEQVGYWRKANHIHKWFVYNVQDGEDDCDWHNEVTAEDLEELLAICKTIKSIAVMDGDIVTNPNDIADLLPTQSGFFFGGTEYDSWYMDSIDYTINAITEIFTTVDDSQMIYYRSSW